MTHFGFIAAPPRHRAVRALHFFSLRLAVFCAVSVGAGLSTLTGCSAPHLTLAANTPSAAQPTQKEVEATLPAPDALRATSGELRRVALHWEPVLAREVAGYWIERSTAPSDEKSDTKSEAKSASKPATAKQDAKSGASDFEPIAQISDRFQVHFLDDGSSTLTKKKKHAALSDGTTYLYRVRCIDQDGRRSSSVSEVVSATTAAVPSAPEALRAYSHLPRKIALVWDAPHDPTVVRYIVYRSPSARGPFEAIGGTSDRHETAYVDSGLGDLRVFYYRVSAVNAAGGEGAPTSPQRAVTKSEPLPPLGLTIDATKLGVNRITWTPNVEADLAGYRVYRLRDQQDMQKVQRAQNSQGEKNARSTRLGAAKLELVASLDAGVHVAEDRAVAADEALAYQILAVDADGLESAPSDAVPATSAGYALEATTVAGGEGKMGGTQTDGKAQGGGILLRWNARRDEGFREAQILRASALAPFAKREIARTQDGEFLDTDAQPGKRYRYVVVLIRTDGSEAPPSPAISASIPAKNSSKIPANAPAQ